MMEMGGIVLFSPHVDHEKLQRKIVQQDYALTNDFCWRNFSVKLAYSNSNGSYQKWGTKCHFAILNSVLTPHE